MDLHSELDAALATTEEIPRSTVVRWISEASDLQLLSKLYALTGEHYCRIRPDLGKEQTCALIRRYLLQCIVDDVRDDDAIPNRFEAAWDLHAWFLHLLAAPEDATDVLTDTAQAITALYLAADPKVQDAIETGFLEHALETETLRPFFQHWAHDPRLQQAWNEALQWGLAHPNFTADLLRRIKEAQDKADE